MGKERGKLAVYPGTFDPLTMGHVSLIKRGQQIFDNVIVAVAADTSKNPLFSLDERVEMAREVFKYKPEITVEPFSGLLVDYAAEREADVILRGLRAVSDFEYEFQLALMNRHLKRSVQTVFLMTDYQWLYISSTIVKAAASLGGDIKGLVPDVVYRRLRQVYGYDPKTKDKAKIPPEIASALAMAEAAELPHDIDGLDDLDGLVK